MESIRVQWITYSGLIGLFTTRLPVFQWKARGYDWSLVDSIGQPSNPLILGLPVVYQVFTQCAKW